MNFHPSRYTQNTINDPDFGSFVIPLALFAVVVLIAATIYRLWAVLRLVHAYWIEEYDANPKARRLLMRSRVALIAVLGALLTLSFCSGLWWVELAASFVCIAALAKLLWAIDMRRSGRYRAFYAARFWR
jgi:glucose-6-phosphate-specific signal transduction histidine kinase